MKEFREFIARGNVIDLAVAVIIGAAFGKIITSLVEGIIMPPIGLLLGGVDFANLFIDISGKNPASLADAQVRGLPVIAYGVFLNDVISFLIIAFVIFLIVKALNKRKQEEGASGLPSKSIHPGHNTHNRNCREGLSTAPAGKGKSYESIVIEDRASEGRYRRLRLLLRSSSNSARSSSISLSCFSFFSSSFSFFIC